MKLFKCQFCSTSLHFDSLTCSGCHSLLGYISDKFSLSAVVPNGDKWMTLADPDREFYFCANAAEGACNWLVPAKSQAVLCECCSYNKILPNLSNPKHFTAWRSLEQGKHRLFYSLMRWQLPMPNRRDDPDEGLAFKFLADMPTPSGGIEHILTGHDKGVITLNIAEADDLERETLRVAMGEPYRTVLGHFRHEIGHYYWDRLVRDTDWLKSCRELFGDERADYDDALHLHYKNGPPSDWQVQFISGYASAHPWEDFAETWAHYMHMVDAIETANSHGVAMEVTKSSEASTAFDPYTSGTIDDLFKAWVPVTMALNSLSRSMGQRDLYPFVSPEAVNAKLRFVHDLVRNAAITEEQMAA